MTRAPSGNSGQAHSVFAILESHAAQDRDRQAIIEASAAVVTYAELLDRLHACAVALLASGWVPGEVTGVAVSDEMAHLVCAMALISSATPHVNLPRQEMEASKRAVAERVAVKQVITDRAEPWMAGIRTIEAPSWRPGIRQGSGFTSHANSILRTRVAAHEPLVYRLTSGSTDVPKSFPLTLERLFLIAERQAATQSERRCSARARWNSIRAGCNAYAR